MRWKCVDTQLQKSRKNKESKDKIENKNKLFLK